VLRCGSALFVAAITFTLVACPQSAIASPPAAPALLASDPADIAVNLVTDEQTLRDPSSSPNLLAEAAHRQQVAYRALGLHPEWDATARSHIPSPLLDVYDRNVDARRQLTALAASTMRDTLPAWRVVPPAPAEELLDHYHTAEAATGVDWSYLAAINMIETGFGRIVGVSEAAAQGPMQFLPATFEAYGDGGDIHSPRDSIMAAGRLLAANGFGNDHDRAVFAYNHSNQYVRAVDDYAAVLSSDPVAFAGYYRWDTYYRTTAGDVLLPIGYAATLRIPVGDYLSTHPQ
jgi:hypothetical protein